MTSKMTGGTILASCHPEMNPDAEDSIVPSRSVCSVRSNLPCVHCCTAVSLPGVIVANVVNQGILVRLETQDVPVI